MAWGWTAGRVQYRDYFDNHAPLFHILTAPFVAALGERANILFYMRALMVPLWVVVLVCTFVVAERLYSRRVAMWSVLLLSLFPPFFLKSLEYRTDNLWTALWMIALLLLFSGPPSVRRSFVIGLVLGCALAVSMKTILLLATVAGAGFITRHVTRDRSPVAAPLLSAAVGLVIVPAIVAGYFIAIGAWSNFVYCVISFNTLIAKTRPSLTFEHIAWPFAVAAIILVARRSPGADERRLFCGVVIALFCVTLLGFWVLISPRDFLPVMPLAAIFSVAVFERFDSRFVICTIAAATLAISLFYYADRFEKRTDEFVTMMNQVLRLTRPGEPVMDLKGETIFRRRPYYYIFELITHEAIAKGLIADRVPEDVVAARCHVAQADGALFPARARAFLRANFLDLGRLRASGQWIQPDGTFTIGVPGRYVAIDENGQAAGTLDSAPYAGARELSLGAHRFDRAVAGERVAVLWAPAFERGFSPFHLQDRNFRYRGHRSRSRLFR